MSVLPHVDPECTRESDPDVELEIEGRAHDLGGGFTVRRLLPAAARRLVGPFVFFDHMGPAHLAPGRGLDVRPHPHINLATVTYLFEGEILHRDSLGSEQLIRPGAVNWMTAGRGIVHSERSPASARATGPRIEGLQLWLALPKEHEEVPPDFAHHPASDVPDFARGGVRIKLVAGSAYGERSPVRVHSPLFYVDAVLDRDAALEPPEEHAERAVYIVQGVVECDGKMHPVGAMLVLRPGAGAKLVARGGPARLVMIGGAPLDGERFVWWNFVSSSRERIEQAQRDWQQRRFPLVPGDEQEFIPLPDLGTRPR